MPARGRWVWTILAAIGLTAVVAAAAPLQPVGQGQLELPSLPPSHVHMRRLLANALQYLDPRHGLLDPASGYLVEGWNQQPEDGLFLRSFTQLTAIGAWIELLANLVAGYADNPHLSRELALTRLDHALATLIEDQGNPSLAAKGLLVNFLGLEGGERKAPLIELIERRALVDALGVEIGQAVWQALIDKGWLAEEDGGQRGRIRRSASYGMRHFDGALAPYAAEPIRSRTMGLLDQRARTIIFGDNANLTASLAKAAGALLRPEIRDDPEIAALRARIERFIEGQRAGYAHLFDARTGTFVFGWDATADRFIGWDDGQGNWVTGQMNYLINEFRGPLAFVVLRYGLPSAALRNAGFKVKPYDHADGRLTYTPAAWDGSAFQLLGLSLFMQELDNPSWRSILETLVDLELGFSRQRDLPGLLSEAYSGRGSEYTGLIGIPDLAVTDRPLITDAPSLYALGVAYGIAPDEVERFLGEQWPTIARLLTDHGPWEGWSASRDAVIPYQTTAHTLSLILGGIDTAQENMLRYMVEKGLHDRLAALYPTGDRVDLLAPGNRILPWTSDLSPIDFSCELGVCRFASPLRGSGGMAFVLPEGQTASFSNGRLRIRFRSTSPIPHAAVSFKRAEADPLPPPTIPVEIFLRIEQTQEGESEVILPATPALSGIQEVGLTFHSPDGETPVDVWISALHFIPFTERLAAPR